MKGLKRILAKATATAAALVLFMLIATSAKVAAQEMSDMPYDLHFIDMTIMHHQDGVEMAQLAQSKAVNAKVKAFAAKTAADQQKDIEELQAHRNHWYAGKPLMDRAMMDSMMKSMHPDMNMDMEETRRKLRATSGAEFDRLFLDTMIHHHMMAVDMSKEAITKAEHPELKDFARKTVTKQQAEITEMNRLKGGGTTKKKAPAKSQPMSMHKH